MATNLLIGHNNLAYEGSISSSTTAATGYLPGNAFLGDRSRGYKTSIAVTTSQITIDLGASVTAAPDFVVFARLDLIRGKDSADIEARINVDDNSGMASPQTSEDLSVALVDLVGPDSRDFVLSASIASAERYVQLEIVTTDSIVHEWPLVAFGEWFDFGRDPSYPATIRRSILTDQRGARRPQWSFNFTWQGVTDSKRNEFLGVIKNRDLGPVWLYDQNDYVLQGDTLICAYIEDVLVTPQATDSNEIKVIFREVL